MVSLCFSFAYSELRFILCAKSGCPSLHTGSGRERLRTLLMTREIEKGHRQYLWRLPGLLRVDIVKQQNTIGNILDRHPSRILIVVCWDLDWSYL